MANAFGGDPFDQMGAARRAQDTTFFQPGKFVVVIDCVKVEKSAKGNTNFQIETTVKATSRPDTNPLDSSAYQMMNLSKLPTAGNIKAFILALLPWLNESDMGTTKNPGAPLNYGSAVTHWVVSQDESTLNNIWTSLPPSVQAAIQNNGPRFQPLRGLVAAVWAYNIKTQEKGEDFTKVSWSLFDVTKPIPVLDAEIPAPVAELPPTAPPVVQGQGAPWQTPPNR